MGKFGGIAKGIAGNVISSAMSAAISKGVSSVASGAIENKMGQIIESKMPKMEDLESMVSFSEADLMNGNIDISAIENQVASKMDMSAPNFGMENVINNVPDIGEIASEKASSVLGSILGKVGQ